MSCPPISITNGLFIPATWSTAPSQTAGDRTVTRTESGITVEGPGGSVYHPTGLGFTSRYSFFGTGNHLLILDVEQSPGGGTRHVSLVDFTGGSPSDDHILTVSASGPGVVPPIVEHSQGNGAVFLISASDGSQITNTGIWRSDQAVLLCPGPPPFVATGETRGEATATELVIHYSVGGSSMTETCPKPQGSCQITPATQTFPDAVIGADPSLATTVDTFTIRNNGTDCLTINAIADSAPFFVESTSQPLPASLDEDETMTVTVRFSPTAIGTFDRTLAVTRTPAVGDDELVCEGEARAPIDRIGITPGSLAFGTVLVGDVEERTAVVRNTGEVPVTVSWAGSSGGQYSWSALPATTLAPGGERDLTVRFEPTVDGPVSGTVPIDHDAATGPHSVNLTGAGCIPNPLIAAPSSAPSSYGQVQRGFRMVRWILVRNTGDAQLTFQASITGPDAALFGLVDPEGSITNGTPTRAYAVDPVEPCGPGASGPGEVVVAVMFFANDVPRTVSATLVLDAHNGSNTTPASYSYPLTAEIVPGIPVDGIAVFDRSGSMSEPAGPRTKTELSVDAGRLFAQLIREDVDDRLGIVKFNEIPQTVEPLTAVTAGNHDALTDRINATELAPQGNTGIAGGLAVGFDLLGPAPADPRTRAVVVLTDGNDNRAYLDPDDSQWYSLLGGVVRRPDMVGMVDTQPISVPSGVRVYAIGLGTEENIDHGRLDALSAPTGGYFGIVGTDLTGATYFNLEKYFTQIYMNLVGTEPVLDPVYTIVPGDTHRIEFDVLRGDVGALVVLYDRDGLRLPFHLESPTGEVVEASLVPPGFQLRSGFTEGARFVEFRLPAGEPDRYAGRWAVVVHHPGEVCFGDPVTGNRQRKQDAPWGFVGEKCRRYKKPVDYGVAIGVGSNLRMQPYVTPGIVHVGDPLTLTAVVTEAGLPVTGCHVTARVEAPSGASWVLNLRDDGSHNDGDGGDGEYARKFVHTYEAGTYQLTFRAEGTSRDGEPVVREAVLAKYVEGRVAIGPVRPGCKYEPPTEEEEKRWLAAQPKREQRRTPVKKKRPS